jgi:RNA polymerase primary sigma factor
MNWEFYPRGQAGDAYAASQSRIIIEGDHTISPLEIFVREVLQNSLDAAEEKSGGAKKVRVHIRLHRINDPRGKESFLSAIGWTELKKRVAASNRVRLNRQETIEFGDPDKLEKGPINILEISEIGTIGLVGPEAVLNEMDERRMPGEPPKAYIALTRDDARREKQGLGSGGTYGLGKAVLWAASEIQTVFFFSHLSTPWKDTTHRAAAQARLGPHFIGNNAFRGLGYGGDMKEGWCRPIRNQQAQDLATKLGVGRRAEASEAGTTIVIPFWSQPDSDVDDELATHVLIARYAARYFWPAIIDGRLDVTAEGHNGANENASSHLLHYQPFIELYQRVRQGQHGPRDAKAEDIRMAVPKGPPPTTATEASTFVRAALCEVTRQDEVREDFKRKVACVRGQGMVVGYAKMTGNTQVKPLVGLALGGRAPDMSPSGVRGDVHLSLSDYVPHTRWDEKSASLRHWPLAKPVVRELLVELRNYFETHSREDVPETPSDLSPLEEGLRFPGAGPKGPPPPPPGGGVPQLRSHRFEREDNRYAFEIRARATEQKKPSYVVLWVEAGLE